MEKKGCLQKIGCLVPLVPIVTYLIGITDGLIRYAYINGLMHVQAYNVIESPIAKIAVALLGLGFYPLIARFRPESRKESLLNIMKGKTK